MKLNGIDALGVTVVNELVKTTVKWKAPGKKEVEFDIFVKKEVSAADFEFMKFSPREGRSLMANKVHRLARMGDAGEEIIPLEVAITWKPKFLLTICAAIDAVQKEDKEEVEASKN